MIYLRRLAHLMEHQHLTLVGAKENMRYVVMTDRRLTMLEKHITKGCEDEEFHYVPSFKKGLDPMKINLDLDAAGMPVVPKGTEFVTAEEDCKATGRKLMEAEKTIELIESTIVGTIAFTLPNAFHTVKDDWAAIWFREGKMFIRTAKTYGKLAEAKEFEFALEHDAVPDGICFAMPTAMWRVCKDIAGDNVVISVNRKNAVYVGIRTPDFTLLYFCKPLNIEENPEVTNPEETTEGPENSNDCIACGNTGKKSNGQPCICQKQTEEVIDVEATQSEVESPAEEPGAAEEPQVQPAPEPLERPEEIAGPCEAAPDGDGGDDEASGRDDAGDGDGVGDGPDVEAAAPKTQPDDVDPQEALDTIIPDLVKEIKELTHRNTVEITKVLKNAAKQTRKALKSQGDPEEVKALKTRITELEKANTELTKKNEQLRATLKEAL